MTLIAVPILMMDSESALRDCREARDLGADLVELRVDSFFTGDQADSAREIEAIVEVLSGSKLPMILTCRPVLEGGHYDGPDDARVSMFERVCAAGVAGEHPPRYLDCELATYTRSENLRQKVNLAVDHQDQLRSIETRLILSSHDFTDRPDDLFRRVEQMNRQQACQIVKIAYRARCLRDNLELLDLIAVNPKPTIALAMGPFGLLSRVFAPKVGAFLTFAALRREAATAPGQPVLSELMNLYRFRSIGPSTKLFGVIGFPVEHSKSPLLHNAGFESLDFPGVYVPMAVMPGFESFKATVLEMIEHERLDLAGLSVTLPHKEHLVTLAQQMIESGDDRWRIDRLSTVCGAANTLVVHRAPAQNPQITRLDVLNTDGPAALAALTQHTGPLVHAHVVVLGAGGTARALAATLADDGAHVHIVNRTYEHAQRLAADLIRNGSSPNIEASTLDDALATRPRAIINSTPLGMNSEDFKAQSPLNNDQLRSIATINRSCVIADCIYNPQVTPLLALAQAHNLKTVSGVNMFVNQASEQFRRWTGQAAPTQLFERILRESLSM